MMMMTNEDGKMTVPPPRSDASSSHAHDHGLDPQTKMKNAAPGPPHVGLLVRTNIQDKTAHVIKTAPVYVTIIL